VGCFPSVRRPRVLWAGLTGAMESISKLQAEINQATARIGEAPEDRPFTPHLTLARIQNLERTSTERFAKAIERGFRIEVEWNVASVALMQSHLSPQGARYETLAEINLATK
jgi:2'-5' RNA ligase